MIALINKFAFIFCKDFSWGFKFCQKTECIKMLKSVDLPIIDFNPQFVVETK